MASSNLIRTYLTNPSGDAATFAGDGLTSYSMTSRAVTDILNSRRCIC